MPMPAGVRISLPRLCVDQTQADFHSYLPPPHQRHVLDTARARCPHERQLMRNSFLAWNMARVFLPIVTPSSRRQPEEEPREKQDIGMDRLS